MDRIRTGLTGLAAVFLVTAAASLLFAPNAEERVEAELAKTPGEPLAQLGVAPSNEKSADEAPANRRPGAGDAPAPADAPPASPASAPDADGVMAPGQARSGAAVSI